MNARGSLVSIAGLLLFAAAGCGPPEAEFVLGERTAELHQDAQSAVDQALDTNFGTPHDLVAWLRLPVNYGGHAGTVAVPEADEAPNTFAVDFDPPVYELEPGQELTWLGGAMSEARLGEDQAEIAWTVAEYDPERQVLTVQAEGLPVDQWPAELRPAEGDTLVVQPGSRMKHGRALYMEHCMHCHGVSGDGDGPTAPYLNPRPRDYRLGLFKFTSTVPTARVTRDDLERTVRHGIPGTYMPSFLLLEDDELDAIVEYVRWLAMRGEFEKKLVDEMYSDYAEPVIEQRLADGESAEEIDQALDEYLKADFPETVNTAGEDLADVWTAADDETSLLKPGAARVADTPESRERGRALYYSDKAKCATCHGPQAEGNGSETFAFRDIPNTNPVQKYPEPGLFDEWGHKIEPRDLTRGIYRGGRRPIDIYRRVTAGIKGTPMPAFTILTEQERWDLVNFVLSVPYLDEPLTPPPGSAAPAAVAEATVQAQPASRVRSQ